MGRSRYKIHEKHFPYFLTSTIKDGLPLLSQPKLTEIVLESFRFLQKERDVILYAYVIMENHFHIIAKSEELSKNLRLMKSYSGRRIVDQLIKDGNTKLLAQLKFRKLRHKRHNNYQIWSEGLHPKQLTSDEMLEQKLEYIHYNPVACGFVDRPGHWRYSSARNYFGLDGLIPITLYEG